MIQRVHQCTDLVLEILDIYIQNQLKKGCLFQLLDDFTLVIELEEYIYIVILLLLS